MPLEAPTAVESAAYHQLEWLDYSMIGAYLVATVWMALIFSRRQHSAEEYFLGGRRMPWFAVGLSLMATLTSTVSYLATPGEVIKYGVMGAMGGLVFYPLIYLVIAYGLVPVFLRLRVTSIYEYLEQRFDVGTRMFASAIFLVVRLNWMGLVLFSSTLALAQITQLDRLLILAGIGVIAVVYTTLGGMRAVIWTDVAQFFILFGGALFTVAYVVAETGTGPAAWWQAIERRRSAGQSAHFQLRPLRTGNAGGDGPAGLLLVRLHLRRRPGGHSAADVHRFGESGPAGPAPAT